MTKLIEVRNVCRQAMSLTRVHFVKMNGRWVAQLFSEPSAIETFPSRFSTCVSWQTVGTRRDVDRIIRDQLTPENIGWTIE